MKTINERMKEIGNVQSVDRVKVRFAGLAVTLVGIMMFGSGCAHTLDVKNLRSYQNTEMNPLQKPLTIGVVPSTEDTDSRQLMKGIGTALSKYSATVLLPYAPEGTSKVDVVANINIHSEYKGSGWNFLINFPGFLVFAPAWNAYVYKANYNVDIMLARGSDNSKLEAWSMPINLNLRQAEFDRTWTEIGWLEWGVIPLIGGIVFTGYDTDVTRPLVEKIENPIGDYIAQEIVNRINNCGSLVFPPPVAAPAVAAPPVTAPAAAPEPAPAQPAPAQPTPEQPAPAPPVEAPPAAAPPVAAPPAAPEPAPAQPAPAPPVEAPPAAAPPVEAPPAAAPPAEAH